MYGMVNSYLEQTIRGSFGDPVWQEIAKRLELPDEPFVEMEPYDDAVTFGIVTQALDLIDIEPKDLLHAAGKGWVSHTAQGTFSTFYQMTSGMEDFIASLDQIHGQLSNIMEGLKPPQFTKTSTQGGFFVDYTSHRDGLGDFVAGLLEGLGEHFNEKVDVQNQGELEGGRTLRFLVTYVND